MKQVHVNQGLRYKILTNWRTFQSYMSTLKYYQFSDNFNPNCSKCLYKFDLSALMNYQYLHKMANV